MSTNNLPQRPTIAYHVTDREKAPVTTSASSQPQFDALTSLTATALTTLSAASRLGLGTPQRIMVEHAGGPVLLCSFLDPAEEDNTQSTSTSTQGVAEEAESEEPQQQVAEGGGGDVPDLPPMLISIVVGAGEEDTMEARRTAGQLERMGRAIQREWAAGGGLEGDGDGDGDGDGAA